MKNSNGLLWRIWKAVGKVAGALSGGTNSPPYSVKPKEFKGGKKYPGLRDEPLNEHAEKHYHRPRSAPAPEHQTTLKERKKG